MNHIAISYYYRDFNIEKTLMSDKALKGILVAPKQVKRALRHIQLSGSAPTKRFGSSPNSMPNTMRNELIAHIGLLIGKGSIRLD